MVMVPDVTGESAAQAKAELAAKGFDVTVKRGFPFLGDTVSGQSVSGGDQAPQGSTITLTTSGL
jgi:serine/threonine-protein kinase